MSNRRLDRLTTRRTLRTSFAVLFAALVFGCAVPLHSPPTSSEPAGPPPSPLPGSSDGEPIEEVVVSGSRVPGSMTRAEQIRAKRRAPADQVLSSTLIDLAGSRGMSGAPEQVLSSVSADEEIWVITQPTTQPDATADTGPGTGAMVANIANDDQGPSRVPLPLEHTNVRASIDGYISSVNVRQQFHNPYQSKIEAVYLFPLPEKAAVSEFLMIIGERRIRGILREKKEAQAIYRAARAQGYRASLLVQHRPNVFEQKVANIEPGDSIDVDIRYFHTLAYSDGWYSFVFPTVVGPRYNPPGAADPIVAVPRKAGAAQGTGVTVPYLHPTERSAHDLSIDVAIDAGVAIEEITSTHSIETRSDAPETASVTLAERTTIPNRDFVLRFRVAGARLKTNLVTHRLENGGHGYFTMVLYPPSTVDDLDRQPMEMVFVIDCSGSMRGRPLKQAKAAVRAALNQLRADDTFQIIRFSDGASHFGPAPVPATARNLAEARTYLARLSGTGGTAMIEGVKAALGFPHDPQRLRFVSFMTDGYIGNDRQIIGAVHHQIGDSRVFSFGVGKSVNRYLLERMAKAGRGAAAYLGLQDSGADIMSAFFERISRPALTHLQADWGAMHVTDVYPSQLPDLFVGRPVVVTGRYTGEPQDVVVSGMLGNNTHQISMSAPSESGNNVELPRIWARLRIADLADRQTWQRERSDELATEITRTALDYQLMSDYTSFVAVDSAHRTAGTHGTTVHQALPMPDGVRYDTTVRANGR